MVFEWIIVITPWQEFKKLIKKGRLTFYPMSKQSIWKIFNEKIFTEQQQPEVFLILNPVKRNNSSSERDCR